MNADEREFLLAVYRRCDVNKMIWPRTLINESGFTMNYKRAWYLLEKWCGKQWYGYGTTIDLGWLTEAGKDKAKSIENA